MPSEDTKILEFNQYYKSDKAPFVIYVVLECIIKKIDECKNNPKNSFTTKVSKHIPSGFSICPISSLRNIENKHDLYRGKDYMKTFREFLREHAINIINSEKKQWNYWEMRSRNGKMEKTVIFIKKKLKINIWKTKNIVKLEIIVNTQGNKEVLCMVYII